MARILTFPERVSVLLREPTWGDEDDGLSFVIVLEELDGAREASPTQKVGALLMADAHDLHRFDVTFLDDLAVELERETDHIRGDTPISETLALRGRRRHRGARPWEDRSVEVRGFSSRHGSHTTARFRWLLTGAV